jgi:hypothetical protein
MPRSHILTSVGGIIGIAVIVLGVVAVSTSTWIILSVPQTFKSTYSLFDRCNETLIPPLAPFNGCTSLNNFQTPQGLILSGVIVVGLGIIASMLLSVLYSTNRINLAPQILLLVGPTLILIGAVFYVKNVLGNFTQGQTKLDLGYSFILIMVTCIIGYISAGYFLLINGINLGYKRGQVVVQSGYQ